MFVKYIARGQKGQTMNSNQKQKKLSMRLSVALAILIVATLCVTIAALTAARRSRPNNEQTTAPTGVSTVNAPSSTAPTGTTATEKTPDDKQSSSNTPASNVIVWSSPVEGGIVKEYSVDVPVYSLTMEDWRIHTGIDIGADAGADVLAAADGVITDVRYDPMMGQTVVIDHGSGYTTIYQNMQTTVPDGIAVGAAVRGGQKIGSVGDTALIEISDSPHLHFAVTANGKYVSPLSYINVSASAGSVWYED